MHHHHLYLGNCQQSLDNLSIVSHRQDPEITAKESVRETDLLSYYKYKLHKLYVSVKEHKIKDITQIIYIPALNHRQDFQLLFPIEGGKQK